MTIQGCNSKWSNKEADLYWYYCPFFSLLEVGKEGSLVLKASSRMSERPVKPLIKVSLVIVYFKTSDEDKENLRMI
ncbi:hypothetical protein LIT32_20955 [Bacillus sp. CMF21]|uniref:hypothetical protein n=1 Tax=Metabacillus dongyingensis TaxID=2874282 RepID=UPI001CBE99A9|nr:hypothetical protein [Metabacillus dongyingensis]UAL51588.1 hypothetical protein K8L98_20785 [Metabacillus dongyingensis]UOK57477.1 hypothetical protein MGI18_23895 [Bacillus sp. OVS6]USK27894.1 hypothetical protein LIT32_20955 [Bacillus sp. CMF21]